MGFSIDRTILPLVAEAQRRLGMSQEQLGTLTGASRRSVSRWYSNRALPAPHHVAPIIRALHPRHRDIAVELAKHLDTTLVALGLEPPEPKREPAPPPPPPPAPVRPYPPTRLVIDSVVCAAAEALGTPPAAVRPVVQAAFARARGLGVSVDEVDDALSGKPTAVEPAQAKSAASSSRKKA